MTRTIDNKELLYIEGNIEESIKKIIKDLEYSNEELAALQQKFLL